MKTKLKPLAVLGFTCVTIIQLHSQAYIVPNGVVYIGNTGLGYEIDVLQNPTNSNYTGFGLHPEGNLTTFSFQPIVDEGVRVFLVSANDAVSLHPIFSQSYTELTFPNTYVFNDGTLFYVGFYTGNQFPQNGIYPDPLFGWAQLVNNNGMIQLLDSALEYGGGGIFAGTQTIIPVPEPGAFALAALGALLLGWRRWRNSLRAYR